MTAAATAGRVVRAVSSAAVLLLLLGAALVHEPHARPASGVLQLHAGTTPSPSPSTSTGTATGTATGTSTAPAR